MMPIVDDRRRLEAGVVASPDTSRARRASSAAGFPQRPSPATSRRTTASRRPPLASTARRLPRRRQRAAATRHKFLTAPLHKAFGNHGEVIGTGLNVPVHCCGRSGGQRRQLFRSYAALAERASQPGLPRPIGRQMSLTIPPDFPISEFPRMLPAASSSSPYYFPTTRPL